MKSTLVLSGKRRVGAARPVGEEVIGGHYKTQVVSGARWHSFSGTLVFLFAYWASRLGVLRLHRDGLGFVGFQISSFSQTPAFGHRLRFGADG